MYTCTITRTCTYQHQPGYPLNRPFRTVFLSMTPCVVTVEVAPELGRTVPLGGPKRASNWSYRKCRIRGILPRRTLVLDRRRRCSGLVGGRRRCQQHRQNAQPFSPGQRTVLPSSSRLLEDMGMAPSLLLLLSASTLAHTTVTVRRQEELISPARRDISSFAHCGAPPRRARRSRSAGASRTVLTTLGSTVLRVSTYVIPRGT